jgi:hypothetical protein
MRYRLEVMDSEPVIRNVEADVVVGTVPGSGYDAKDPALKAHFDDVVTSQGEIRTTFPRQPLENALGSLAFNEAFNGYPGLKHCTPNPDPVRVEFTLGRLVADAVSVTARGILEYRNGSLRKETKKGLPI